MQTDSPQAGIQPAARRTRNRLVTAGLAWLLGAFGVHRFYMGQWWGVFYLLLCWTGIPAIVALVEGLVFLLTDQARWDEKHNAGLPTRSGTAGVVLVCAAALVWILSIGGLAAIAVSAHEDFNIRAQVIEGFNMAGAAKAAIALAVQDGRPVPPDRAAAGLAPESGGRYVESVAIANGRVDITYRDDTHRNIAGRSVSLTPYLSGRDVVWRCGYGAVPRGAGRPLAEYRSSNIAPKYLPSACR